MPIATNISNMGPPSPNSKKERAWLKFWVDKMLFGHIKTLPKPIHLFGKNWIKVPPYQRLCDNSLSSFLKRKGTHDFLRLGQFVWRAGGLCCSSIWYVDISIYMYIYIYIPVVPHEAVAEVSRIGNV